MRRIINVYAELAHRAEIMRKTENIYNTTLEILILHLPIKSQHIRQL
jgi:hypothetical protein